MMTLMTQCIYFVVTLGGGYSVLYDKNCVFLVF